MDKTDVLFVGDAHAKFDKVIQLCHKNRERRVFQVGDMGIGFTNNPNPKFPTNLSFIRGNHDNPELCAQSSNYLGDYGYIVELDLFYIGGAWSIDANQRVEGVSWWRNEELNSKQLNDAFDLYAKVKPKHVISHDAPKFLYPKLTGGSRFLTGLDIPGASYATPNALEAFWNYHQPKLWVFGHHHRSFEEKARGTVFVCLKELETLLVELDNKE